MRYWQVRADTVSGAQFLFGVRAEDREEAQVKVLLMLEGTDAIGVELTEIPPPEQRKPVSLEASDPRPH
jgi:hypothetical protein